jgi:hypothetical protein
MLTVIFAKTKSDAGPNFVIVVDATLPEYQ